MSDKEYSIILDCALMNISEEPRLPPSFRSNTSQTIESIRMLADKVNLQSQIFLSHTVFVMAVEINYALLELCNRIDEESPLAYIVVSISILHLHLYCHIRVLFFIFVVFLYHFLTIILLFAVLELSLSYLENLGRACLVLQRGCLAELQKNLFHDIGCCLVIALPYQQKVALLHFWGCCAHIWRSCFF